MSSAFGKRKKTDGVDFYPTEPLFTEILCDKVRFSGPIWEPACGDGAISKILRKRGHQVVSTDAFDHKYGRTGIDFLQTQRRAHNIVTNPPSFVFDAFVVQALRLAERKIAFLFGSFLLGSSKARYESLWKQHPPTRVILVVNRMRVFGESSQFTHCWAVWDKITRAKTTQFEWVHR